MFLTLSSKPKINKPIFRFFRWFIFSPIFSKFRWIRFFLFQNKLKLRDIYENRRFELCLRIRLFCRKWFRGCQFVNFQNFQGFIEFLRFVLFIFILLVLFVFRYILLAFRIQKILCLNQNIFEIAFNCLFWKNCSGVFQLNKF